MQAYPTIGELALNPSVNNRVTIMVLLKFIGLFTIFHSGNWNQQGGVSLRCGMRPFVVVWRHDHVAGQNFEEILQHLIKENTHTKRLFSSLSVTVGYLCM